MSPGAPPQNPFREIENVLRVIRGALETGSKAKLGSDEALGQIEAAIWAVTAYFSDHIQAAFPRPIDSPDFQADTERALELFRSVEGFPGHMAMELQLAFAGLQVGEVRPSVKPRSRRGGVSTLEQLFLKSIIVGAADRLKARGGGDAAYQCELNRRGLNSWTVEDYRRQIARTQITNLPGKFIGEEQMDGFVAWARDRLPKKEKGAKPAR